MTTTENPQHEVEQDDPHRALKSAYRMGYEAGQQDAQEGRIAETIPPVVRQEVECPSWCESSDGHLEQRWVEDVYHEGPHLEPVEVTDLYGQSTRLLDVNVWTSHDRDGRNKPVLFAVRPDDSDPVHLSPDETRELVKRLRAHLDAVLAYVDRYSPR